MHEVSTWQLLKIYSLCTQQVEKNANTFVGLNDFSHAVTAPLDFHRADTWACLQFQLQKIIENTQITVKNSPWYYLITDTYCLCVSQ